MALAVWGTMKSLPDTIHLPVQLLILVFIGMVSYVVAMAALAPALAVRLGRACMLVAQGRRNEAITLVKSRA